MTPPIRSFSGCGCSDTHSPRSTPVRWALLAKLCPVPAARTALRLTTALNGGEHGFRRCEKPPTMFGQLGNEPPPSGGRGLTSRECEARRDIRLVQKTRIEAQRGTSSQRGAPSIQWSTPLHTQPGRASLHRPREQLRWQRVTCTAGLNVPRLRRAPTAEPDLSSNTYVSPSLLVLRRF